MNKQIAKGRAEQQKTRRPAPSTGGTQAPDPKPAPVGDDHASTAAPAGDRTNPKRAKKLDQVSTALNTAEDLADGAAKAVKKMHDAERRVRQATRERLRHDNVERVGRKVLKHGGYVVRKVTKVGGAVMEYQEGRDKGYSRGKAIRSAAITTPPARLRAPPWEAWRARGSVDDRRRRGVPVPGRRRRVRGRQDGRRGELRDRLHHGRAGSRRPPRRWRTRRSRAGCWTGPSACSGGASRRGP